MSNVVNATISLAVIILMGFSFYEAFIYLESPLTYGAEVAFKKFIVYIVLASYFELYLLTSGVIKLVNRR